MHHPRNPSTCSSTRFGSSDRDKRSQRLDEVAVVCLQQLRSFRFRELAFFNLFPH